MIVLDTSVFTDYLVVFDENRHRKAKKFIDEVSERDFIIYEPYFCLKSSLREYCEENIPKRKHVSY